jgi:hypothetical protein
LYFFCRLAASFNKRIKSDSTSGPIFCKNKRRKKNVQLAPHFMRALNGIMESSVELEISGRSGKLVYLIDNKSAEAYVEMSGSDKYDFLVDIDLLKNWSNGDNISGQELSLIKDAFVSWANNTNTRCQW